MKLYDIKLLRIRVFIFALLLNLGCADRPSTIRVNLTNLKSGNPISTLVKPIKFLENIPEKFIGIQNREKTLLGYIVFKNYSISPEDKFDLQNDSVFAITFFENGNQNIILDSNKNLNFSDDEILQFENIQEKTNFDLQQVSNQAKSILIFDVNRVYDSLWLKPYPNPKYYNYIEPAADNKEKLKRSLTFVTERSDYYFGAFSLDHKYKVAVVPYGLDGVEFIFQKKDNPFPKYQDEEREIYLKEDIIELEETFYKIKFSAFARQIELEPMINIKELAGFRKGYYFKNIELQTIGNETLKTSEILKKNDYLLIDFWGTWCGPCKELTPELVNLHKNNSEIEIMSIAFQSKIEDVKKYTLENKMDWPQIVLREDAKNNTTAIDIIKKLRIDSFPTFLLINSEGQIVYRGTGNKIAEIQKVILNNP